MLCSSAAALGDGSQTVSKEASPEEQAYEWTLERMLMATPMPLTGEERNFLASHPPLPEIRSWTLDTFKKYTCSAVGRSHTAQEAARWRDTARMLRRQVAAAGKLLGEPGNTAAGKINKSKAGSQSDKDNTGSKPAYAGGTREMESASCKQFETWLSTGDPKMVFDEMRHWRQEIANLAPAVEQYRKAAAASGLSEQLEQALSQTAD